MLRTPPILSFVKLSLQQTLGFFKKMPWQLLCKFLFFYTSTEKSWDRCFH